LDDVKKHFSQSLYNQKHCDKCEIFKEGERHSSMCDVCPSFLGKIRLWNEKEIKGKTYYGVPSGHLGRVQEKLSVDLSKAKDKRKLYKLPYDLKFVGELYDGSVIDGKQTANQKLLVQQWMRKRVGLIQANPRTGKTVIATKIVCELNCKTIIFAHLDELLQQFLRTFKGGTQGSSYRKAMTNVNAIEKRLNRQVIGIAKTMQDVEKFDIVLVNYKKFMQVYGEKRINKLKKRFSLVIVDEVHRAAASAFSKVIAEIDSKYKLGLTATPLRRDGRDFIVRDIIGPVVAKSESLSLIPVIKLKETGIGDGRDYKSWHGAMKFLAENKERNELIVNMMISDAKKGKKIIVPLDWVKHIKTIVSLYNKKAKREGLPPAVEFHGKSKNRDNALNHFDEGKYSAIVSMRKMIKEGVDLISPDTIYIVIPMGATDGVGAPMFEQLVNRVCTYMKGKKPEVQLFVDHLDVSFYCFKSIIGKEVMPKIRGGKPKYIINSSDAPKIFAMLKMQKYTPSIAGRGKIKKW
jgi:hypothetical protein